MTRRTPPAPLAPLPTLSGRGAWSPASVMRLERIPPERA
jgi:hypothetical protein